LLQQLDAFSSGSEAQYEFLGVLSTLLPQQLDLDSVIALQLI
jgi:hypothetical protein